MAKLEELITEMENADRSDMVEELKALRGGALRKKLAALPQAQRERDELAAKVERLERAPQVQEAFSGAGLNLNRVSKLERRAIEGYEGELDEESVHAWLEDNGIEIEVR